MMIQRDGKGQPYIEWKQGKVEGRGVRRAWIQRRTKLKDWAGTGRYLAVARCDGAGRAGALGSDFPIFSNLPDAQILQEFVRSVCRITGWKLSYQD
jgi:hypothetical protein